MNNFKLVILLVVVTVFLQGCSIASRKSTTQRTAVEEALLTSALSDALKTLEIPAGDNRSIVVDTAAVDFSGSGTTAQPGDGHPATTAEMKLVSNSHYVRFILSAVEETVLSSNFRRAKDGSKADVIVYPRIEYASIDDSDGLVGIPSIPFPIPGVGTVESPELALFGLVQQRGRVRLSLYAVDRKSGELLFTRRSKAGQRIYSRWTVLILFTFRTTNLSRPF